MNDNIMKIWGERRRLNVTKYTETDLLYLIKDSFCSTHQHKYKINKFIVIQGNVRIETEYGITFLKQNENFTVYPPMIHRFLALEDSIMIEIAYTLYDIEIDTNDIFRHKQGGRIIKGKEITLDEMKELGLLNLGDYNETN